MIPGDRIGLNVRPGRLGPGLAVGLAVCIVMGIVMGIVVTPVPSMAASALTVFGSADVPGERSAAGVVLQPGMGDPLAGLTPDERARFDAGLVLFDRPLTIEEGLGPIFNKESCGNCHNNPLGGTGSQTVTRFGFADKDVFDPLERFGGSLLQAESISKECAEELPPEANVTAMRVTNGSLGYGLIEAILDDDIRALEQDPPGISGRVHEVEAFEAPGVVRVGRFGWKAQVPTILTFTADAALNEMGLTNRFLTEENDPNGERPPRLEDCDTVPDPEDGPDGAGLHRIDRMTDFQRFLAAPPQTPRSGMQGEALFMDIGCGSCHHPSYVTADDPELEGSIRAKAIRPYSDFLLHGMGLGADFIAQGDATEQEIRTPPLWGVRRRDPMWHDGRFGGDTFANRVTLVIEEHGVFGSEALDAGVIENWTLLSDPERTLVLGFLDSLGRLEFDGNGDHVIDLDDFTTFVRCFDGDGAYDPDHPCAVNDVDQDGDVDESDYELFLVAYTGPRDDCNENGVLDLTDIVLGDSNDTNENGVPDECEPCLADLDDDGSIGFGDVLAVLAAWGPCPPEGGCSEDLDASGVVDFGDVRVVLAAWGPCR